MSLYSRVYKAFTEQNGFEMHNLYCQSTGKAIGWTHRTELESLVNLLAAQGEADAEQIADDIAMRILASMRPSLHWNKLRSDTLMTLMDSNPIDTLAYMLNRLFAPINWRTIGIEPMLGVYADRIKAHILLQRWGWGDVTRTMLELLIELDAKWGLDTEWPPFNACDFYFQAPTHEHRLEMLQSWFERRMDDWQVKQKALEMQSNWTRMGNPLAKPAFAKVFYLKQPPSQAKLKKMAKAEELDMMRGLLNELMNGTTPENAAATAPAPIIRRKSPMTFGVK